MFCKKCGSEVADGDMFCPNCGSKVIEDNSNFSNNSPEVQENAGFNQAGNNAYNGNTSFNNMGNNRGTMNAENINESTPKEKSNALVIIVIILSVIAIAAAILYVVFVVKPFGNKVNKNITSEVQTKDNQEEQINEYKEYYDKISDKFSKFIMSDEDSGKLDTYKEAISDALDNENTENAKYNYEKLVELEESLKEKSESKIQSLKDELKKWEKKSSSKSAKKGTEYKKNKSLAENEMDNENYKMAETYYNSCIDELKAAKSKADKKKKEKAKENNSSKDDWYKTGAVDDTTYSILSSGLDYYDVKAMSNEEKRYYINTLFAMYGYRFSNSTIQSFFDNQSWYYPDYDIAVGDQNAVVSLFDDEAYDNYQLLKG